MELRQLRYLLTIAEETNFTRAAERLYITQSALSQQMQSLEAEVGTVLLDRSRRGARLTPAGALLCHYARRALKEVEDGLTALNELEGLKRGSVAVGAVQTANAYLVPQIVAVFARLYPAVRLIVEELPADGVENGLRDGRLQVGIGFVPAGQPEIEGEILVTEELVLVVGRRHPLATKRTIDVRELGDTALVLLSTAFCTRRLWDRSAQTAAIAPRVAVEMNTVAGILSAVRQTDLASVLPAQALALDGSGELRAVALRNPTPCRSVGLLWRSGGYLCAASRAFLDVGRQVAAQTGMALAGD